MPRGRAGFKKAYGIDVRGGPVDGDGGEDNTHTVRTYHATVDHCSNLKNTPLLFICPGLLKLVRNSRISKIQGLLYIFRRVQICQEQFPSPGTSSGVGGYPQTYQFYDQNLQNCFIPRHI